jgi:probable addiction module antidote protein
MTEIARKTGLGRQSLHEALSPDGYLEFATILQLARALGLNGCRRLTRSRGPAS